MNFFIDIHGCPKATADAEYTAELLLEKGFKDVGSPDKADIIIVQTCSFIKPAREECEIAINNFIKKGKKVVVSGCYPEIFYLHLKEKFPNSILVGANSLNRIVEAIENEEDKIEKKELIPNKKKIFVFYTGRYWSYLRISEGCSHNCTFCIIPSIRGKYRSFDIESILNEAKVAEEAGKREIVVVSQDSSYYHLDKGEKNGLKNLLFKLNDTLKKIEWIRVMYLSPMHIDDEIIEIFGHEKILPYFDIPFQHADKKILNLMKRGGDIKSHLNIIKKIREKVKHSVIRSTLIVGFPSEGKKEFKTLLEFIKEAEFEHLGVFPYYDENLAFSHKLNNKVKEDTKRKRIEEIIATQREIFKKKLKEKFLGKKFKSINELRYENGIMLSRTWFQAPEGIDGWTVYRAEKKPKVFKTVKLYDFDFKENIFYGE